MQTPTGRDSVINPTKCALVTFGSESNEGRPRQNEVNKAFQKNTKLLLRYLVKKLERKFVDRSLEHWGYRQAAAIFHQETGCSLRSAEKYFYHIQDIAEWCHILGRPTTYRDNYSKIGSTAFRLP